MSIGAVPNCPEMVVNSVKAVMGSKCRCMDRMDDEFEGEEAADEEQEAEQDELLFQVGKTRLRAVASCTHMLLRPNTNISVRGCVNPVSGLGGHVHATKPSSFHACLYICEQNDDII